jgi:hypothetical protein
MAKQPSPEPPGTAKEKVARGNPPQILTAAGDVADGDEDIGDGEAGDASRRRHRQKAVGETIVARPLFNPGEKSACRFSADAGSGIAPCNFWLMLRKRGARIAYGAAYRRSHLRLPRSSRTMPTRFDPWRVGNAGGWRKQENFGGNWSRPFFA